MHNIITSAPCYGVMSAMQTSRVLTNERRVERKETLMRFLCKTHVCTWDALPVRRRHRKGNIKKSRHRVIVHLLFNFANLSSPSSINHLKGIRAARFGQMAVDYTTICRHSVVIIIFTIRYSSESFRGLNVFLVPASNVCNFFSSKTSRPSSHRMINNL